MLKKLLRVLISLFVAAISFFVIVKFCTGIGYQYLAMLIGSGGSAIMGNPLIIIPFYAAFSLLVFANVLQLLSNKISVVFLKAEAVAYFIAAFSVVMLKSRGVQGFNFDFLDILSQYLASPFGVLVNLVVFVPMGAVFRSKRRSALKAYALALAIVLAMETAQYVFHLGIFDVVDIVVNMAGFALGYLMADVFAESGLRLARPSRWFYRIQKAEAPAGIDANGATRAATNGATRAAANGATRAATDDAGQREPSSKGLYDGAHDGTPDGAEDRPPESAVGRR